MGLQVQVLNAGTSREINTAFDTRLCASGLICCLSASTPI